ncbi:MAG: 2-dehydropantoate 2-reductase [Candidatus Omnitrophica bacterium]|nr:2-dehydropantoate 2-reductase [Candidatus Omnitrophota bacterium]MBU1871528.1 2-dehydropantoate 2-reductase [Candidatus Omnitrophota bacterium]
MKIVVAGPGAIGSLFASYLTRSKEEVWLLDKDKSRAEKLNQKGISIEGVSGSWHAKVKVSVDPVEIGKADLLIVCVKSYDTRELINYAQAVVGENCSVLTLQNGIGNVEVISEALGKQNVFAGITSQGANLAEPGKLRHAGLGETVIGSLDGKLTSEARLIRQLFNDCRIPTRLSRDIKGALWSKLIINVGINALTAITHLKNGQLLEFEGTRSVMRQAVAEATKIAKRKRIKLQFDDALAKVEAVAQATANNISSMLSDVLKKKRTEIDFINGVIVRQGQSLGMPVVVNSILLDLVKTLESSYLVTIS